MCAITVSVSFNKLILCAPNAHVNTCTRIQTHARIHKHIRYTGCIAVNLIADIYLHTRETGDKRTIVNVMLKKETFKNNSPKTQRIAWKSRDFHCSISEADI